MSEIQQHISLLLFFSFVIVVVAYLGYARVRLCTWLTKWISWSIQHLDYVLVVKIDCWLEYTALRLCTCENRLLVEVYST